MFSKQKEIKMNDYASKNGYKKPQCKRLLTTDEVLTALFDSGKDSDGLESDIMQPRSIPEISTLCGYKKNKVAGKRTNKHTLNYCEKCQKDICEGCLQAFHT